MKRTCFAKDECPIARSLEVIGDWWSLLIVRNAFLGTKRFGEFLTALGIARNILTVRLKKLVRDGVLDVVPASDRSAYKDYVLTRKGKSLFLVLVALGQWGESCLPGGSEFRLVDRKRGRPVRIEFRTDDGRRVELDDVRMAPVAGV